MVSRVYPQAKYSRLKSSAKRYRSYGHMTGSPSLFQFGDGVQSMRVIFEIFLRTVEVFLGIQFVAHFFSDEGFFAGLAGDISNFLEYINFDKTLPGNSGIETPLAFLTFVLLFMLIGYAFIIVIPKFSIRKNGS